jgi:predicted nucleic acid-binding protein
MAWLLDTNILSERRKPKPEPRVTAFYDAQPLNALYIRVPVFNPWETTT